MTSIEPPCAPYGANRLFEWTTTAMLLCIGLHLLVWPTAIEDGVLLFMYELVGPETLVATYLVAGSARLLALLFCHKFTWWGPRIRVAGSILGALIWMSMDTALLRLILDTERTPSIGIWIYTPLVVAELISTYRAAADVRF